jgi:hypothetical protein
LGSIATSITGAGNVMDSSTIGFCRVAQRLTGGGVLQTHHRDDLAGTHAGDLLTLVGVHPVDLADALLAVLDAVEHLGARVQHTGVDADVGQLAQVRVSGDLERQRRERFVVAGLALELDVSSPGL